MYTNPHTGFFRMRASGEEGKLYRNRLCCIVIFLSQVKDALKTSADLFDMRLPTDSDFQNLEDLVAALRPIEILTKKLCEANFNVLKVISCRVWNF